ncbi:hypothetical protein F8M41_013449 [Gigaspora margarita]|uniref:Uncharacterized protein n=1 Tax=Gigaspora margarita TaxID=4874 RepID=A0A8H3WWQ4_GIGMA|nr:hypothetical protein F8M41_013449 [Gigaspora margarita]
MVHHINIFLRKLNTYTINSYSRHSQEYILPNINHAMLNKRDLDIDQLSPDDHAKIFIYKLYKVVKNVRLDIETSESLTDSLVDDLLFLAINFNDWPLMVDHAVVLAKNDFVINNSNKNYSMLVIEKLLSELVKCLLYKQPTSNWEMLREIVLGYWKAFIGMNNTSF